MGLSKTSHDAFLLPADLLNIADVCFFIHTGQSLIIRYVHILIGTIYINKIIIIKFTIRPLLPMSIPINIVVKRT